MCLNCSLLYNQGAEVQVVGKIWDDANAAAMEEIKANPDYAFVHPFDHPTIWCVLQAMT